MKKQPSFAFFFIILLCTSANHTLAQNNSLTEENDSLQIGLQEVKVFASFVNKQQETPIVTSTVYSNEIQQQISNKEFPEILKGSASVYATRQGGGVGDSRINLRGFGSENIGVLINGIPVNGMENGAVYWSNWASLADVTQSIQVQRGLGVSKLGIPSVGGTINIITKTIDAEQGGSVYYGLGNDGYQKEAISLSTGLMKNGWAITFSGSHSSGDGYVNGTSFAGWSYFLNVSKRIKDNHLLSFTAFGAPQWHNMRPNYQSVEDYNNNKDGIRMNTAYGYHNGKVLATQSGYNEYHKPQLSLNHFWTINEKSTLSTSVYASMSKGGGRSVYGAAFNDRKMLQYDSYTGKPFAETALTPDGLIDYDRVMATNQEAGTSKAFFVMGTNAHNWYGLVSSYSNQLTEALKLTAGIDGRYYEGLHYQKISDLLGGTTYKENKLAYRDPETPLKVGDKVSYDNTSHILWTSAFTQLELVKPTYNAFLSFSVSDHLYKRVDPGLYGEFGDQAKYPISMKSTNWKSFIPTTIKAGFSYKFGGIHNVFVNGGYITKAPAFDAVFPNKDNMALANAPLEKVGTVELGYRINTSTVSIALNGYYTKWMDKSVSTKVGTQFVSIPNVDATHKGIELEAVYTPVHNFRLSGSFSLGDWRWDNNASFVLFNDVNEKVGDFNAYIKDLHVGNAPQTSVALSAAWEPFPQLRIGATWNYYGRNYAAFDPVARNNAEDTADAWKMPSYSVTDAWLSYGLKIGQFNTTLYCNANNLFNQKYIADAKDGKGHDEATALVWYGFGITWTTGVRVAF